MFDKVPSWRRSGFSPGDGEKHARLHSWTYSSGRQWNPCALSSGNLIILPNGKESSNDKEKSISNEKQWHKMEGFSELNSEEPSKEHDDMYFYGYL